MSSRLWQRLRALLQMERRSILAGGRDVYETTRRSLLSLEARAGALLFAALWVLSQLQSPVLHPYPFDPGPAYARLAAEAWLSLDFFRLLVFVLFLGVGAGLGLFLRNAWDLAEEFLPLPLRRRWPRLFRWSVTTAALLFLHGGFLVDSLRRRPSLYKAAFHDRGWVLRIFQDWLGQGFLSWPGRLWTFLAAVVILAGLAQMGRRFFRWFRTYPVPTQVASGVLGMGAFFFILGLWGVFRFHRPSNDGPNVVVIAVEGLRTDALEDKERNPALVDFARRGTVFASCVPTVPQREAALMTFLTGRSPLSHGVRHAFPANGDLVLGSDSLPGRLRRAGFTLDAAADAGGDLLGRLGAAFDRVRAPDLSVPGIRRRDILRRSVHLLPYARGRSARQLMPSLRGIQELSDPRFLSDEGEGLLKQLRFEPRFFLLLHFSAGDPASGGGAARTADLAVRRVMATLNELGLDDSTWVVLWSPYAAPASPEKTEDVASPVRFQAPLVVVGPVRRPASRWVSAPVRDVDVAPTILSAAGVPVPDGMEGLPLLDVDAESEGFAARDVYTETGLWTSSDQNPLPPALRLSDDPPSAWLEEDPEAPGRLRVRPDAEDASLSFRHRLLQAGNERLVYRPSRAGVLFEYYDLTKDPSAATDLANTRAGAERVRELKEVLFQELRHEAGWRPQNDFWIPEAFMRDKE